MFNPCQDFTSISVDPFGKLDQWLQSRFLDPFDPVVEELRGSFRPNLCPESSERNFEEIGLKQCLVSLKEFGKGIALMILEPM